MIIILFVGWHLALYVQFVVPAAIPILFRDHCWFLCVCAMQCNQQWATNFRLLTLPKQIKHMNNGRWSSLFFHLLYFWVSFISLWFASESQCLMCDLMKESEKLMGWWRAAIEGAALHQNPLLGVIIKSPRFELNWKELRERREYDDGGGNNDRGRKKDDKIIMINHPFGASARLNCLTK